MVPCWYLTSPVGTLTYFLCRLYVYGLISSACGLVNKLLLSVHRYRYFLPLRVRHDPAVFDLCCRVSVAPKQCTSGLPM